MVLFSGRKQTQREGECPDWLRHLNSVGYDPAVSAFISGLVSFPTVYATIPSLNDDSAEVPVSAAVLLSSSHRALSLTLQPGVLALACAPRSSHLQ